MKKQTHQLLILVTLLGLMAFSPASAQVQALFEANNTKGCGSLLVQFTNQSTGVGTLTYHWDFGNGQSSSLANPQTIYQNPGIYTVSLITSNGSETDTLTKTNLITIYNPPIAGFSLLSANVACQGSEFAFANESQPGDTTIKDFTWDFGNQSFSTDYEPTHSYATAGVYSPTLFITDHNGCESSISKDKLIEVTKNPVVNFTSGNTLSCADTQTVVFTNLSTGLTELSFEWNFGDSQTSFEAHPTHFYQGFGNYTVTLKATDDYGCSTTLTKANLVKMQDLQVAFTYLNDSLCKNQELELKNQSIGATNYFWSFSDTTNSTEFEPLKSFSQGGTYTVELIGKMQNICSDTARATLWVDSLQAGFMADKTYGCELPFTVNYQNLSAHAAMFTWKFGNGTQISDENPSVTFNATTALDEAYRETYSDTLIATSLFGCTDTVSISEHIEIILPKIYFTPNDTSANRGSLTGCVPLSIDFLNKSQSTNPDETLTHFSWDFGNGQSIDAENASQIFTEPGEYTVELTVTNSANCINRFTAQVEAGTPQIPDFTVSGNTNVCGSEAISFVNQSTNDELIDAWEWFFSDGRSSNLKNPMHVFTDTGYMDAVLSVFYNGCKSEPVIKDSVAYIKGPAGSMQYSYDCSSPLTYEFASTIKGADSIFWEFGDGSYDSTQTTALTHTYAQNINYPVKLYGHNYDNGCAIELAYMAKPRLVKSNFAFGKSDYCLEDSILLDGSASQDESWFWVDKQLGNYFWTIGNDTSFMQSDGFYYQFPQRGEYQVNLLVTDLNGCSDDTTLTINIHKPQADFITDTVIGCSPLLLQLSDFSASDTTLVGWNWYINNTLAATGQIPSLTLADTGFHSIQLIVEDAVGCTDSLTLENAFYTSRPQPKINVPALINCQFDSIPFQNLSAGNLVENTWFFGDGFLSDSANPIHAYTDTGYFHLQLYLMDSLGCDTTYRFPDSIYIEALPKPDFTFEITNPSCYPALVKFYDASEGAIKAWNWNFGDESAAVSGKNPLHTYQKPGWFDVSLLITSQNGCKNTLNKADALKINGPFAQIIAPDEACINNDYWFSFEQDVNIYTWEWLFEDGTSGTADSLKHAFDTFGWQRFNLLLRSDSLQTCNKLLSDSLYIPLIKAQFQLNDSIGCEPLEVFATNESLGYTHQEWWLNNNYQTNTNNAQLLLNGNTDYNLKLLVKNELECADSIMKTLTVFGLPEITVSNDTVLCIGDTILLSANGGESYSWFPDYSISASNTRHPMVFPDSSLFYRVRVTDTNLCVNSDSVWVTVQQIPEVTITNTDTLLIIGESLLLESAVLFADFFQWSPPNDLDCFDCLSTLAQPKESTTYYLTASDPYGCFTVTDSITLKMDVKYSLALPSAFTPNDDGANDAVFVKGWGIKELVSFEVYNKFGLKVFETNDIHTPWDGKYKGAVLSADVYYYKVVVLSYDNAERVKTGEIFLLK
ncbi:MAG: PKD domain-containing protein [Salinivirgaceae bacterium]